MSRTLDVRRLLCPLPVIRTQDRVADLTPGEELEIVATDPGVLHDLPAWCRINGHDVLSTTQRDGEIRVQIRIGATHGG